MLQHGCLWILLSVKEFATFIEFIFPSLIFSPYMKENNKYDNNIYIRFIRYSN